MHQISLWSVFFVSFPEELLIVLVTLTVAGYKEVLNFKDRTNLIKLLLSSTLMVSSTLLGRILLSSLTLNFLFQCVIFYCIIILFYRYKPLHCAGGFIFSLLLIIISEAIFTSVGSKLLNLSFSKLYSKTVVSFILSLPDRLIQLVVLSVICKKRNIRIYFEKVSHHEWIPIILYCVVIICSMFSLEEILQIVNNNSLKSILILVINICVAVAFSAWLIHYIYKVKHHADINEKMHNFELKSIKKMLEDGLVDHVINLIDCELENRMQNKK